MLIEMNTSPKVMCHFPKTLTKEETEGYFSKLQKHFEERGYTYFAVDVLDSNEWIGFIGLAYQDYVTEFSPGVDVGWRLHPKYWGNGFATEGAKRCLEFAFDTLELDRVFATCTLSNEKSEKVMQNIGMSYGGEFLHPKLTDYPKMQRCKWYEIQSNTT
jgi:RimJ/RimL family protein N-acetyltransferase